MFTPSIRSFSGRLDAQSGFSLIELIVVMVIIGIVTATAAPNFSAFFDKQRNNEAAQTLVAAFREARTESQLRRQDIIVRAEKQFVTLSYEEEKDGEKRSVQIRQFPLNAVVSVSSETPSIVFKANKSVRLPENKSGSKNTFTYNIICNVKSSKTGSSVNVDNNGNIKIDNGASQCS